MRRYGIKVAKPLWHEELGLRNLMAFAIREAAKHDKVLIPLCCFSHNHYYKCIFEVRNSRDRALEEVKKLSYISIDPKTQDTSVVDIENRNSTSESQILGKTYIGNLCDKDFINKMLEHMELIEEKKDVQKLLEALKDELDILGSYNPHKLESAYKFNAEMKYEVLIERLKAAGHEVSRCHNNRYAIKTTAKGEEIVGKMRN